MGKPPAPACLSLLWRQKAQEIDLLADLGNERKHNGGGRAEQENVEAVTVGAGGPRELRPGRKRAWIGESDEHERNEVQGEPKRLRPGLETADEGDAVGDQRNDYQRAHDVA